VTLPEVREAAGRLQGVAIRTPLLPFHELSRELGCEIRLKCECLQRGGSFKLRGAFNHLSQLSREERDQGVVTYSSGNHAQALALAGRILGIRTEVVMPTTAPAVKVEGARRLGAHVHFEGTTSEHRKERAYSLASETGLAIVPPFDHRHIIAGQGTVGTEIFDEWPEVDMVLAPIGGGGLVSGVGAALKGLRSSVQVFGVEAEGAPTMRAALDSGEPVTLDSVETIADGLKPVRASELTLLHARRFLDDVVLVDDGAIREATALLLNRRKLVVEFSGAATLAAVLSRDLPLRGRRVVAVLSGGNLDPSVLSDLAEDRGDP
jgi:threonine dehydratase